MTYLGPNTMELPVDPDAPPEPFSILPGHPRNLQIALLKTIEQGYKLTFSPKGGDVNRLGAEPYTVLVPAEPEGEWTLAAPNGSSVYATLLLQLEEYQYTIRVVPV